MHSVKIVSFLFLFFAQAAFAQLCKVTIIVTVGELPQSESIFVAGSLPQLGNWAPGAIKLQRHDAHTFSRDFAFPKGASLEFKFTRGSWSTEAVYEQGKIPQNHSFNVSAADTLRFDIPYWRDKMEMPGFTGKITGTTEIFPRMDGEGILPRDVIVWLPPGYERDSATRYPVLYMHDGQNIFNPATSAFGIDWQVDECADSLIRNAMMRPVIIVGMYNTDDRYYDYSPGEKGSGYMNFIIQKVKPFIDSKYRTKPGREYTATAGSSMGGLISFMLAWEHPEVFSMAACFSPAFKYRNFDYTEGVRSYRGPKKDIRVYIDNGGVGLEAELQPGVDAMLAALDKLGYHQGLDNAPLMYVKDAAAEHNEPAWAKRVKYPLLFFFGR